MTTITAGHFEAALDAAPEAWDVRLQYADWLDGEGKHYAALAQRWMAKHKSYPARCSDGKFRWPHNSGLCRVTSTLNGAIQDHRGTETPYRSRMLAELALAGVLQWVDAAMMLNPNAYTEVLGLPSLEG